jgi:hypothetical protein
MYYPYFRGKQFELLALRESASLIASARFVPIIEPVRESLSGLERTLRSIADTGGNAIVIVNPRYGDHRTNGDSITALLARDYPDGDEVSAGVLLRSDTTFEHAVSMLSAHAQRNTAVIHAGFTEARDISTVIASRAAGVRNIFIEDQANMLYRRHFSGSTRVLIRDGFERKRNADYDEVDSFSDLHVIYRDIGMNGYGDFLTVGDSYSEGGGPAYAVAIHLTYIDPDHDNAMFSYHFVSDTNDTPTDPAGKFAQALEKLMNRLDRGDSNLAETRAISEFRELHARGHFPGLGYIKKLSINHHLETLADYHSTETDA